MRRIASLVAVGALLAVAGSLTVPATAHNRGWFPRAKGECGWVHGRFIVANGSGVRRLWVIGTGHVLYLSDDDHTAPLLLEDPLKAGWKPWEKVVYGDFYTCAADAYRKGHMQRIRVERIGNYVITEPL